MFFFFLNTIRKGTIGLGDTIGPRRSRNVSLNLWKNKICDNFENFKTSESLCNLRGSTFAKDTISKYLHNVNNRD